MTAQPSLTPKNSVPRSCHSAQVDCDPTNVSPHSEFFEGDDTGKASGRNVPIPVWDGAEYQRIPPGRNNAVAVRVQGPEWVYAYKRWSLMVEFELLGESPMVRVCAFFNMGRDERKPKAGRRSRYYAAWTIANGEPPRKKQAMDPKVFVQGQVYLIEVADCAKDSENEAKPECQVYSRVTKILSVELW